LGIYCNRCIGRTTQEENWTSGGPLWTEPDGLFCQRRYL